MAGNVKMLMMAADTSLVGGELMKVGLAPI